MHRVQPILLAFLATTVAALPSLEARTAKAWSGIPAKKRNDASKNSTLVPNHFTWEAPGEGDSRSPCPMLNSLSNHGFLPHDGRNITHEVFSSALSDGISFDQETIDFIFEAGIGFAPQVNATSFDLEMLHVHNIIEHDGSLSRRDIAIDPSNEFHEPTFNNFLKYFGDEEEMTIAATANARARHALDMSKINPRLTILPAQQFPIVAENAAMLGVWGQFDRPVANRSYYEFFFRNERLPVQLGWSPSAVKIGLNLETVVEELIANHPTDVPFFFNPGAPVS